MKKLKTFIGIYLKDLPISTDLESYLEATVFWDGDEQYLSCTMKNLKTEIQIINATIKDYKSSTVDETKDIARLTHHKKEIKELITLCKTNNIEVICYVTSEERR